MLFRSLLSSASKTLLLLTIGMLSLTCAENGGLRGEERHLSSYSCDQATLDIAKSLSSMEKSICRLFKFAPAPCKAYKDARNFLNDPNNACYKTFLYGMYNGTACNDASCGGVSIEGKRTEYLHSMISKLSLLPVTLWCAQIVWNTNKMYDACLEVNILKNDPPTYVTWKKSGKKGGWKKLDGKNGKALFTTCPIEGYPTLKGTVSDLYNPDPSYYSN